MLVSIFTWSCHRLVFDSVSSFRALAMSRDMLYLCLSNRFLVATSGKEYHPEKGAVGYWISTKLRAQV